MNRRIDPTDWMWAHACELLDEAGRRHRKFFRLAASSRTETLWEPPADVFEDEREIAIVVALPGVSASDVDVAIDAGVLVVRAVRPQPLGGARRAVRQLEIPYGEFERRIALPAGAFESVTRELTHGCLVVRLGKVN